MRGVPVLTAVIIGAAAVILGCGQQHGTASAPAVGPTSPAASARPAPTCPGGGVALRTNNLTITNVANGNRFCVTRGTAVTVYLKGTPARKWAPIRASSAVLKPSANGALTLALGVTGASFTAAEPGTAVITSSGPVCGPGVPPGDSAAGTGTVMCDTILAFRVTVTVAR